MGSLYEYDLPYMEKYGLCASVDEVGRGSLAGPICAASVILPPDIGEIEGLKDSKKLSELKRHLLAKVIKEKALAWSVVFISSKAIDALGLQRCNIQVMINAVEGLKMKPNFVLFDHVAGKIKTDIPHIKIIRGDTLSMSIAASSVLAKTARDLIMVSELANRYPEYYFHNNKGYGTQQHIEAIQTHGLTEIHRRSFCRKFIYQNKQMALW